VALLLACGQWDVEEEEREQEKKQKKLSQAELLKQQKREKKGSLPFAVAVSRYVGCGSLASLPCFSFCDTAADQDNMVQKPEGFVARLVQKAIDNIQITIEKIHIRYEDNRSEVKNVVHLLNECLVLEQNLTHLADS
jgi:hypothetical protein